ncbi:MAG TPA: DUF1460 domain-containing protein [Prolixibacteraceae bacterium]|jgi:cell wall-associated NlpC family hydrolase|nr:DUF1460 domain-containing protein [Prolixibacteraceae bacterium]
MKNTMAIFLLLFLSGLNTSWAQSGKMDRIFQPEDKHIAEDKLNLFSLKSSLPISELITQIGLSFLGTPYVAATLENGLEEKLVINLRELDCTTFVENCLALARTVKLEKTDFESFSAELEKIRYRDGIRNQYPSRLHYFSEWIHNNQKKGFVSEWENQNGKKEVRTINFMSTHPESYPVLKGHPEVIPILAEQEKGLTQMGFQYFSKDDLPNLYKHLQPGDIVGLTSSVEGLDVNHTGIIIRKNNEFYLMHASQSGAKVMVSEGPIGDFLKPQSKNTGIIIARPVF